MTRARDVADLKTSPDFTGTVTADGLTVDGNAQINGDITVFDGTGDPFIKLQTNEQQTVLRIDNDASDIFQIRDSTNAANRLAISTGGDISFYEDTGSTAKFFWDASAESLGIGTTTPTSMLQINQSDSTASQAHFTNSTTGSTINDGVLVGIDSNEEGAFWNRENKAVKFATNNLERVRVESSGEIQIGGTTNAGFIDFDGSNLQFNTQRNPNTGTFVNTGRAHTSITMFDGNGTAANSYIRFMTTNANNTAATERMRIDSSGNVGIGCTPKTFQSGFDNLQIGGNIAINVDSTGAGAGIYFGNNVYRDATNSRWEYIYTDEASQYLQAHGSHRWRYAASGSADAAITWSEVMRTDTDGNLLVGTDDSSVHNNTTGTGTKIGGDGRLDVARSADTCATFNRTGSSDGTIVQFRADGSAVGIIGTIGGDVFIASSPSGHKGLRFANGLIFPVTNSGANSDNETDLGDSNARFDDIFATNGTIQTSDENEKQDIAPMTTAELAVGKRLSTLFKTFRWKDKVTKKADKARTHSGIIAQEVKAAFEAEGLDATKYALFCSDTWTNDDGKEQTRMGVRYPELLSFVASYNESRFTAIEARLTALEK